MKNNIATKIAELEHMDMKELKKIWFQYFKSAPPAYQREYMLRRIAYQVQAKAYGGLPKTIKNKLKRLAAGEQKELQTSPKLTLGTRIMREHKGRRIYVTVLEKGFEYDGQNYQSLTAIATKLTGSRTSGPKFFGLIGEKND